MTEEDKNYKEYTLEADSELRFEIEDKNAKVQIIVSIGVHVTTLRKNLILFSANFRFC